MTRTEARHRPIQWPILVGLAMSATPALALQDPLPTPAEWDSLAAAAEGAPLFATPEPLVMTLRTRIEWLRDERPDEEEADGTITYRGEDGSDVTVDVEVRTRGNFRREKRNCNFPPLRLDLPRSRVGGTVFAGQNRLKLVAPCQDSRDQYQQYVLQEFMAYRVFNLVSPVSYRVRRVEITFEDVDGEYETRTKTGFLIEADDAMAHRNRGTIVEADQLHPALADDEYAWTAAVFAYMIGNTDYSAAYFHNVELVRTEDGRYMPVPYDFDFSGVVDARYAVPPPQVNIRDVRERAFRGFCREGVDHEAIRRRFLELRPAVEALYADVPGLDERQWKRTMEFYEDFWEDIESPEAYRRHLVNHCREMPG